MILLIDNYDSFSYNLCQLIGGIRPDIQVIRNDERTVEEIRTLAPDHLILSPGPGIPHEAGILLPLIERYAAEKSILGVCLGQQAIGQAFGGTLENLENVYHGVQTPVNLVAADYIFDGLPQEIPVGRYHSWVVRRDTLPDCLEVTAEDADGRIMGLRHKRYDVHGVQFHPESVLTPQGKTIIENFIRR